MHCDCYNDAMSEVATRQDIDEVIDIVKDLTAEVSLQFTEVHKKFEVQDQKYYHLLTTMPPRRRGPRSKIFSLNI